MRKRITLIFLSLCPLILTCSDDCTYKLKYEVTGTAPRGGVGVSIVNEYGDDEEFSSIRLPWVKEFEVQFRDDTYYGGKFTGGVFPAYVSARIREYGDVTVKIYYSGKTVDSASAAGRDGTATARYGVKLR